MQALLANLMVYQDYTATPGLKKRVLLVEGATDKAFIDRISDKKTTRCVTVEEFCKKRNSLVNEPNRSSLNAKEVIITCVKHLAAYPDIYDFPREAISWPLFGLVDNDFESAQTYSRYSKLFFTDTHDIETEMFSTDLEMLMRIRNCGITKQEITNALFLAYQLSILKQALNTMKIDYHNLNSDDGTVPYEKFTTALEIDLAAFLNHICNYSLASGKKQELLTQLLKKTKKYYGKDGKWKNQIVEFDEKKIDDFWMQVNGHDILSALCYLNENAKNMFHTGG